LKRTLFRRIEAERLDEFSVLDVGAGSGELLRSTARFAASHRLRARLFGIELNRRSAETMVLESRGFREIKTVRGDALALPFADGSFDFVIASLFTHHLSNDQIVVVLGEMARVAKRAVFVIDLHRHPMALAAYRVFCFAFRMSRLVRDDGSLSILRGFRPAELVDLARAAGLDSSRVARSAPFRLVLKIEC
jgi:ubiquinone/menaquinone biosynthesis C-methylase UbiE